MDFSSNRRKYLPWVFIPCILALVLQFVATIMAIEGSVVYSLATFKGGDLKALLEYMENNLSGDSLNTLYLVYAVAGIFVFSMIYKRLFGESIKVSLKGISSHPGYTAAGLVLLSIGAQYFSVYLMTSLSVRYPSWKEEYDQLLEAAGLDQNISVIMLLYALILGPIVEELMFRGVTLSAAKKVFPKYVAIVAQAVLFGLFHGNPLQGAYAFVLGLGLGFVMDLYDNVLLCIFLHLLFNFWGTIGSAFLPYNEGNIIQFFISMLVSLLVCYVSIILLKKGAISVNNEQNYSDI